MAPLVVDPCGYLKPHHSVGHCPQTLKRRLSDVVYRALLADAHSISSPQRLAVLDIEVGSSAMG